LSIPFIVLKKPTLAALRYGPKQTKGRRVATAFSFSLETGKQIRMT